MTPRPIHDVVSAVIDEVTSGKVDAMKLDEMLAEGARQQSVDMFRGDVGRKAEPVIVQKIHRVFADSAADDLLDSLRGRFTKAAEQIATVRGVIPAEQPIEQFLLTATPQAVKAWQALPKAIATIEQIAGIAAMFGCRATALFPLVELYSLGDANLVDDRALWCADSYLIADSAPFRRSGGDGRASPWFQVAPLMLHTVASARERARQWSEAEWESLNGGTRPSVLGPDGQYHELPKPRNPWAA